ncbi:MAG: 50S ribosomal protein L4 [Candidatus Shikimatogenerans sp. AspAUS03]|uniref:Large ribosomal subunit protein uL4 n=1 Tax=Candidatus Shikimatogenerans sp. AspAUS03 TaxID=3158563 RepID=A0AAU7QSU7_9FLAO
MFIKIIDYNDITIKKQYIKEDKNYNYLLYICFRKYTFSKRLNIACTKNRSQVKGSNKKICKQKGTGVARKGSIKNPLFKGGGIIFGPKFRKFKIKVNSKNLKYFYSITILKKINNKKIKIFFIKKNDKPNTKKINFFFNKFYYKKKILFVLYKKHKSLILSLKNINYVKSIFINNLNIYLLLKYEYIFIDKKSLYYLLKNNNVKKFIYKK